MANANIVFDEFVKSVRPDPKSTDQIVYMNGFVGESPIEGHIRVYSDISLNNFTDIPRNAVAHVAANPRDGNIIGGSSLWIRRSELADKGAAAPAGSFLEGDIYSNYARNMYSPVAPSPRGFTLPTVCTTNPSHCYPCSETCRPTLIPPCGFSHHASCQIFCPPPTNRTICCPGFSYHSACCPVLTFHSACCPVPVNSRFCPVSLDVICPIQVTMACPSAVDACPTAPTDPTIYINPGPGFGRYGAGAFNPYMHGGGY